VRIWDPIFGRLLFTNSEIEPFRHNNWVWDVDIHPNGRWIISVGCEEKSGSDCVRGAVYIWDLREQRRLDELKGHTDEVQSVSFVPGKEHQIITASRDSTLRLWDISDGGIERIGTGQASTRAVTVDARDRIFSGGCSFFVHGSCTYGQYTLFDKSTNPLATDTLGMGSIVSLAFSPDGERLLAGSTDHTATLFTMREQTLERILAVQHESEISAVAFSSGSDGSFLTGSYDNTVVLWNAEGERERTYEGMNAAVLAIAVNPGDGRIVGGGGAPENDIVEWDQATEEPVGRYCGGSRRWDATQNKCVLRTENSVKVKEEDYKEYSAKSWGER